MSDLHGGAERSARERLQASREALVAQIRRLGPQRRGVPDAGAADGMDDGLRHDDGPEGSSRPEEHGSFGSRAANVWAAAKYGVRAWWEFHPVRAVGAIAEPLVAEYAERRPFRLLGIAAGVGATLVVVRPWRLVSVGGLAVAALKSSQASSFVLSLLAQSKNNHKDSP